MNINVINVAPNDKVMQNAEQGCISVATKENGSLAYIGIPATNLYEFGVSKSLALKLLEYKLITIQQAADLAELSLIQMLELASKMQIDLVDYEPQEIDKELAILCE